jgi:hypothetical protein
MRNVLAIIVIAFVLLLLVSLLAYLVVELEHRGAIGCGAVCGGAHYPSSTAGNLAVQVGVSKTNGGRNER